MNLGSHRLGEWARIGEDGRAWVVTGGMRLSLIHASRRSLSYQFSQVDKDLWERWAVPGAVAPVGTGQGRARAAGCQLLDHSGVLGLSYEVKFTLKRPTHG